MDDSIYSYLRENRFLFLEDLDKINGGRVSTVCWFCGSAEAQGGCEAELEMHRPIKSAGRSGKIEITGYDTLITYLRRCSRCEAAHQRTEGYVGLGWFIGALVGVLASGATVYALWPLYNVKEIIGIFAAEIVVTSMIGGVIAWLIGRRFTPKDIKDQKSRENHPDLRRLIQAGWIVGGKPLGV